MRKKDYKIEFLQLKHNVSDFDCSRSVLNNFLKQDALNYQTNGLAKTSVISHKLTNKVIGYYTVFDKQTDITLDNQKQDYIYLYGTAVDKEYQGKKIGSKLLLDAMKKSTKEFTNDRDILVLESKPAVKDFYLKNGLNSLGNDSSNTMAIENKDIKQILKVRTKQKQKSKDKELSR